MIYKIKNIIFWNNAIIFLFIFFNNHHANYFTHFSQGERHVNKPWPEGKYYPNEIGDVFSLMGSYLLKASNKSGEVIDVKTQEKIPNNTKYIVLIQKFLDKFINHILKVNSEVILYNFQIKKNLLQKPSYIKITTNVRSKNVSELLKIKIFTNNGEIAHSSPYVLIYPKNEPNYDLMTIDYCNMNIFQENATYLYIKVKDLKLIKKHEFSLKSNEMGFFSLIIEGIMKNNRNNIIRTVEQLKDLYFKKENIKYLGYLNIGTKKYHFLSLKNESIYHCFFIYSNKEKLWYFVLIKKIKPKHFCVVKLNI